MVQQALDGDPPLGIRLKHHVQQLQRALGEPGGLLIYSGLDLSVQTSDVLVIEGEEATQQSVQQHTHGPNISLASEVISSADEFWSGVGGGTAAGLQNGVHAPGGLGAQTEVDQLQHVVIV